MSILALETSSTACSVALCYEGEVLSHHVIAPQQQTQMILTVIHQLMNQAGLTWQQLKAVAVGTGPGSFTGVRIATSVAQAIAFAHQLPVVPVSSLAALAQSAYEALGWESLLVATDARLGEVFWGIYIQNQGLMTAFQADQLLSPEAVKVAQQTPWYGVGSGWALYGDRLSKSLGFTPKAIDTTRLPMAKGVISLAQYAYERGHIVSAADILPTYLRNEVVTCKS